MSFLQDQDCLEVMFQGQGCLRESRLFRGHVFKVRVVLRSCLQGQGCLDIMFTKSGLFRFHIFKVRIV